MKRLLFVVAFAVLVLLPLARLAMAEETVVGGTEGVDLTVYNQNFALVRDQRTVPVQEGINYVRVEDIAAYVDPATVRFESLTAPEALVVREQNYQYDLINATNILNKCVGKRITVRQMLEDGKVREISGKLLNPVTAVVPAPLDSYNPLPPWARIYGGYYSGLFASTSQPVQVNGLVIQTDEGLVFNASGEVMVAELPEGLISRPSLLWKLEAAGAGTHRAQLSYLTQGITWRADYVAQVNAEENGVDLTGWVTLDNRSGAGYKDAGLQLMAGEVRRVTPQAQGAGYGGYALKATIGGPAPTFEEQPFFEYHLYTMTEKTTIADNETKQLSLLTAGEVPVKKVFVYDGGWANWQYWLQDPWSYRSGRSSRPGEGWMTQTKAKVAVMLELKNSKENNLGMPLPKGIVRVYKSDPAGRLQFIGEDSIDHTPKDEEFRLWIGNAFDLVAERKRTDYTSISDDVKEESWEVKLRNHKDVPVAVEVTEHIPADWEMLSNSHDYIEKDSNTIMFPVTVNPDGEVTVTYRVRITYW